MKVWIPLLTVLCVVQASVALAADAVPEKQAEAAFDAAVETYVERGEAVSKTINPFENMPPIVVDNEARPTLPGEDHPYHKFAFHADSTTLGEIPMVVDLEMQTVRSVLEKVVNQVSVNTGAWNLKWRVSAENEYILDEKVNIIAEVTFGQFIDYMVERIKNMTGVQLYMSVFDASRVIVITDTYY